MNAGAPTVATPGPGRWLFSARLDLAVFALPAAIALAVVALAPALALPADTPDAAWIALVLMVDVAHVWSTAFVTYLDPAELRRRPALYAAVPLAGYAAGVAVHALGGAALFWRVLAYLAVFHFVRQQYGWVALYRARAGERDRAGAIVDGLTIYAATLYPLLWWHAAPERSFAWFRPGDFAAGLPAAVASVAGALYLAILATYVVRAALDARRRPVAWGKHLVVATTAACWYTGIVATDGDLTFTVTNVLIHGVPYAALVFVYGRAVAAADPVTAAGPGARLLARGALVFAATLWAVAYLEELLWDRAVWHDRPHLFGGDLGLDHAHAFIVPLLAVPQLTHYVLDGFLWRRGQNPRLALWFRGGAPARPGTPPRPGAPSGRGAPSGPDAPPGSAGPP
ncbi:MAG: hypothetical protein KJZ91_30590 [Myxococcales bacterium]|nr:hypothetical protein [Myxococcales bacterium]